MKAFIEYYTDKPAEEIEIKGIHSSKDGIRFVAEELPFPDDRYDRFIPYSDIQKITIYGVNN